MTFRSSLVVALLCGSAGAALAEAPDAPASAAPLSRPQPTYVVTRALPAYESALAHAAPGFSNIIYLNNCKAAGGCTVLPGNDNSTANPPTSIVPDQASVVAPFAYSDEVWAQVVDCVKKTYSPFGVEVTDVRPASGDFHMAIVAGMPQDVQLGPNIGGVSPFACDYIPNAVSYSFANVYGPNVNEICWTVSQETAHSWGLDHKFDNRDPMTYLQSGPSWKLFQNKAGSCGEFSARACQCGGSQMNSFQKIVETFGASPPTPPIVGITSPRDGDTVATAFPVRATITDDVAVNRAELFIDGRLVSAVTTQPYVWSAPATLGQGRHKIKVIGYDLADTPTTAEIQVALGKICAKATDCQAAGNVCVDGRCVPGSSVTGGLGTPCASNGDCASGTCGADSTGDHFCVESCDPTAKGCPSDFACLPAGEGIGVCWPSEGGGCCGAGAGAPGYLLLGLGVLILTLRRRPGALRP